MNQEPQQKGNSANAAINIARIWAMTLYAPLRIKMGRDHAGIAGPLGIGLIFFYAGLTGETPLLWLILILLVHYFNQHVSAARRRRQGIIEHTEYGGEPRIAMRLFVTRNEQFAKQFGEPAIIFGLGCLMRSDLPYTATYFWWGAFFMFFNQLVISDIDRRIVDQMNNARIEAEYYTQRRW